MQEAIRPYAHGTVRDIFAVRARRVAGGEHVPDLPHAHRRHLPLGLYIWRQGYLRHPAEHLGWWQRAQRLGLPSASSATRLVAFDWIYKPNPMRPTVVNVVMLAFDSWRCPALSLGYAATVVLLWQEPAWQRA